MPTSGIFVIWDLWIAAFCGAASKTYLDWKAEPKKRNMMTVLGALVANSAFALATAPHLAELFVETLPEWSNFGKVVAYLSGAICINIMSALLTIRWKEVIASRLKGR